MPQLGHENFREIESSSILLAQKSMQTVPYRKVFRVLETSMPAAPTYARDNIGSQALYLPPNTTGHINWTIFASVAGTLGTLTELGSFSVAPNGVITYTGGVIGTNINSMTFTPTVNATIGSTGIEMVLAGYTTGQNVSAYIIGEIFPHTGLEEFINYRPVTTSTLATIEGVIV